MCSPSKYAVGSASGISYRWRCAVHGIPFVICGSKAERNQSIKDHKKSAKKS